MTGKRKILTGIKSREPMRIQIGIRLGIEAFMTTWAFIRICGMESTNGLSVFVFIACYFIYSKIAEMKKETADTENRIQGATDQKTRGEELKSKREDKKVKKQDIVEYGLSGIFTLCYVCGDFEQIYAGLDNILFRGIVLLVTTAGLYVFFYYMIALIMMCTRNWDATTPVRGEIAAVKSSSNDSFIGNAIRTEVGKEKSRKEKSRKEKSRKEKSRKENRTGLVASCTTAVICFLCWLPYLLKNFPGVMTIDSMNQFAQVIGVYAPSNHHPWMHTLVMRLFYNIGLFFAGDMTLAIAFYTVFQMLFMAGCVGDLVNTLMKFGVKKGVLALVIIFYALMPYNALYAVTVWKDSMFAGGVLLYVCTLLRMLMWLCPSMKPSMDYNGNEDNKIKDTGKTEDAFKIDYNRVTVSQATDLLMLVISGLLMSLFRTNGWYAFLVTIPFVVYVFRSRWKTVLGLQILVVVAVILIKGPFMDAQHVIQPDLVENLSIPVQQISRVIVQNKPLTEEQDAFLNQILDTSKIVELYNPYVSDGFKRLVRAGDQTYLEDHFSEFVKVYIQIGLQYPADYLLAFRDQSIGYWFPTQAGIIAGDEGVIPNEFGVENRPVLKGSLVIKLNEIALKLKDILPGYGILWCMGALLWMILLAAGMIMIRGDKRLLVLYVPCIAIVLTLIVATPVAKEFRYAYGYIYCVPLYLLLPFLKANKNSTM